MENLSYKTHKKGAEAPDWLREKGFGLLKPTFVVWAVFGATFGERVIQFFEQLALVLGQFHWGLHVDVAIQITRNGRANPLDATAAEAENFAALGAFWDLDGCLSGQGGHIDLPAQRRSSDLNRDLAVQVIAIALEDIVLFDADFNEQITIRAAVLAWLTIACAANPHPIVDASGNLHLKGFIALDLALSVAG